MNNTTFYQPTAYLLVSILYSSCQFALANDLTPRDSIRKGAEQYVTSQYELSAHSSLSISAAEIDERVTIPDCPTPIEYSASSEAFGQSNIAVKVFCNDSHWYMYLMVSAIEMQSVVVMASAVSPGTILTERNLKIIAMNKSLIRRTTYAELQQVIGARIKRRVRPGQPVSPNNLCFVCKGDRIVINASSGLMQVKATGVALEDGNIGETISVKNIRSKKQIDARITTTHEVMVNI
ncbi:MAG: flagella basal body P-ring formation protein FlgA [Paraglaciecola sp.]|jgi:flagella basal body P-ring formation protein FlgA